MATVTTQCRYPTVAVPVCLLTFAFWMVCLVIFAGGALGYISPKTATAPIRVFAGIWAIGWAGLGLWSGAAVFRKAFVRCEFQASTSCFCVRRVSFLGASHREYSWDQVELFTEIISDGRFDRDIAMIVCGRHVALDYSLPEKSATQAVAVLSRWLEAHTHKRAQPESQAIRRSSQ